MGILGTIDFPPMMRVRQKFSRTRIPVVAGSVIAQIRTLAPGLPVRPGQSVAVACPSRGLADYAVIVKSVVDSLKELELRPFIVPAMGSHSLRPKKGFGGSRCFGICYRRPDSFANGGRRNWCVD
jgi:hypothetical protein